MKVQVASDLHIEFDRQNNHHYTIDYSDADIIIFAGDIDTKTNGLRWIQQNIKDIPVIYVLGNHEFYGEKYPTLIDKVKDLAKDSNIHILENDMVTIDGVNFLGCTLWTDFKLLGDPIMAGIQCQQAVNDFKKITTKKDAKTFSPFRPDSAAKIHNNSVLWLKNTLKKLRKETNLIVTHHAPSIQSIQRKYCRDFISSAFASNLEDIMLEYNPIYWVHGHIHANSNYTVGQTKVISNPRGYYGAKLNEGFKEKFIITI